MSSVYALAAIAPLRVELSSSVLPAMSSIAPTVPTSLKKVVPRSLASIECSLSASTSGSPSSSVIVSAFDDHVTVVAVSVREKRDAVSVTLFCSTMSRASSDDARTGSMKVSESSPASMSSEYEVSVGGVRSFV